LYHGGDEEVLLGSLGLEAEVVVLDDYFGWDEEVYLGWLEG